MDKRQSEVNDCKQQAETRMLISKVFIPHLSDRLFRSLLYENCRKIASGTSGHQVCIINTLLISLSNTLKSCSIRVLQFFHKYRILLSQSIICSLAQESTWFHSNTYNKKFLNLLLHRDKFNQTTFHYAALNAKSEKRFDFGGKF